MPDLFIPPEGAMQFEIMRRTKSIPARDRMPDAQKVIWVLPPVSNKMDCPCEVSFPVILDSLTPSNRIKAKELIARDGFRAVACACQGRIIE